MGVVQNHFDHSVKEITQQKKSIFEKEKFTIELWTS